MESIHHLLTLDGLLAVLYLVVLEGVLSVDNALALAALVKGRLKDPIDQAHALRYGIWGAYAFRILIIFIGVWLMKHEWVKWAAAGYLVYISVKELFFTKAHMADEGENEAMGIKVSALSPLWSTIIAVELMDIMFSVDSIAVALSVSDQAAILIVGAVLGILVMRFAAQYFIKLMDRFPILEKTAFVLVLMAGLKIVFELSTLHIPALSGVHIPEAGFMVLMFVIIGGSMAIGWKQKEA